MLTQLSFFQLILIGVSAIFLLNGLWKFIRREQNQTFFKLIYTVIIWGGILIFAWFPDLTRQISVRFHLGESLNTLIFIGFVLVFMAIFKLLNSIEKIEQTISSLVRKDALKRMDKYTDKD